MSLTQHDIAAYRGGEVLVFVRDTTGTMRQLRGIQTVDPVGERPEEKVAELGYDVKKTVFDPVEFTCSVTMVAKDLVQLARLTGLATATTKSISVGKFAKVNLIQQIEDPDTAGQINFTNVVLGWKARSSSVSEATDANMSITLEGSPDFVSQCEGKCRVQEFTGDGATKDFVVTDSATLTDFPLVENPAGVEVDSGDYSAVTGTKTVTFTTAPEDGTSVRIVYSYS